MHNKNKKNKKMNERKWKVVISAKSFHLVVVMFFTANHKTFFKWAKKKNITEVFAEKYNKFPPNIFFHFSIFLFISSLLSNWNNKSGIFFRSHYLIVVKMQFNFNYNCTFFCLFCDLSHSLNLSHLHLMKKRSRKMFSWRRSNSKSCHNFFFVLCLLAKCQGADGVFVFNVILKGRQKGGTEENSGERKKNQWIFHFIIN